MALQQCVSVGAQCPQGFLGAVVQPLAPTAANSDASAAAWSTCCVAGAAFSTSCAVLCFVVLCCAAILQSPSSAQRVQPAQLKGLTASLARSAASVWRGQTSALFAPKAPQLSTQAQRASRTVVGGRGQQQQTRGNVWPRWMRSCFALPAPELQRVYAQNDSTFGAG